MKTSEILQLDGRKKENLRKLEKCVSKIMPDADLKDATQRDMNNLLNGYMQEYNVNLQPVFIQVQNNGYNLYSCGIRVNNDGWDGTLYGASFHELMLKCIIKIYAEIRSGKIKRRGDRSC